MDPGALITMVDETFAEAIHVPGRVEVSPPGILPAAPSMTRGTLITGDGLRIVIEVDRLRPLSRRYTRLKEGKVCTVCRHTPANR